MSDWLIAGVALVALFVYALIERAAVDSRRRDAWEGATQRERAKKIPRPHQAFRVAPIKRPETHRATDSEETGRAAS